MQVKKKHTLPFLLDLERAPARHSSKLLPARESNSVLLSCNNSNQQNQSRGITPKPSTTYIGRSSSTCYPKNKPATTSHSSQVLNQAEEEMTRSMYDPAAFEGLQVSAFGGLESRPLKKLYSTTMHKQYNNKIVELKKRYNNVYKKALQDVELDVSRENIKNIVLKSENVLNSTYSVKYFGMREDQIGVLSKRVSLTQKPGPRPSRPNEVSPPKINSSMASIDSTNRLHADASAGEFDYTSLNMRRNLSRVGSTESHKKLIDIIKTSQSGSPQKPWTDGNDDKIPEVTEFPTKECEEIVEPKQKYSSPHMSDEGGSSHHQYYYGHLRNKKRSLSSNQGEYSDNEISKINEMAEAETQEETKKKSDSELITSPEGYIITRYLLPKKLTGLRRDDDKRERKKVTGLLHVAKGQRDDNSASFERNLKTMSRVKRSMLRSVSIPVEQDYQDELNVLNQYRTHELKELTAEITKYSYSKLIGTLVRGNATSFENAFEEKHRLLERMIQTRKERRKIVKAKNNDKNITRCSRGSSVRGWYQDKTDEIEESLLPGAGTNYSIKVQRRDENELYNTFIRIKDKI